MLIIFDCDGVLVDSEQLAAQVFSDVLAKYDIYMSSSECYQTFHGKTLAACYCWIEENKEITLPSGFNKMLEEETEQRFTRELQPVPGIEPVLKYLYELKVKFCVASNGGHNKIVNSLKVTGLLKYFDSRFSAEDVKQGKPNPDLFVLAATQHEVDASECLVIEDSLTGVQAANAAGMQVLRFYPQAHSQNENTFSDMNDLIKRLPTLISQFQAV